MSKKRKLEASVMVGNKVFCIRKEFDENRKLTYSCFTIIEREAVVDDCFRPPVQVDLYNDEIGAIAEFMVQVSSREEELLTRWAESNGTLN